MITRTQQELRKDAHDLASTVLKEIDNVTNWTDIRLYIKDLGRAYARAWPAQAGKHRPLPSCFFGQVVASLEHSNAPYGLKMGFFTDNDQDRMRSLIKEYAQRILWVLPK